MSAYRKLKPRVRLFVDEYVHCGVGSEAIRRLLPRTKAPGQLAWRYLQRQEVKAAIEERTEEAIAAAGVRHLNLVKAIAATAYLDPADLMDSKGNMKPLSQIPEGVRCSIAAMEVEERRSGKGATRKVTTRIKRVRFESHTQAREQLGQYLKLFTHKHELAGVDGIPLLPPAPTNDLDVARRVAFLLNAGMRAIVPETPLNAPDPEPPVSDSDVGKFDDDDSPPATATSNLGD